MKRPIILLACLAAAPAAAQTGPAVPAAVVADPPRDATIPAGNRQLVIPSHGAEMNALLFRAAGAGPHPTMVLLHGLPGNERNLDLAQAVRRAGWNVLTFTYRGAWGSQGRFTIANAFADAAAVVAFVRRPDIARAYGIDTDRLVIAGHSMGGAAAALVAAEDSGLAGLVLIDTWDPGATARQFRADAAGTRANFATGLDDLGHALAGATAASLTREVEARAGGWDLAARAEALARRPVLTVYASEGIAADNRALAAAIGRHASGRLTAVEMTTDHSFADHRIALAGAVVSWLQALPGGN